jgi:hypothetical protein
LLDQLRDKRPILAAALAYVAAVSLIVAFLPSFLPMALAEALYGRAGRTIRIALAALTIGPVRHRLLRS